MGEEECYELEKGAELRRGRVSDLPAILDIKAGLQLAVVGEGSESFLLGSSPETYEQMLAARRMWLLILEDDPIGFTLTLDDGLLRASDLWAQLPTVEWLGDFDRAELERSTAYFDQLAVLPHSRQRYWSACLALRALSELVAEEGHDAVLTTTVLEPVVNRAALPYLAHLGARRIGRLYEHYPEVGEIYSALHRIEAGGFWAYAEGVTGIERPDYRHIADGVERAVRSKQHWIRNPTDNPTNKPTNKPSNEPSNKG